MRPSKLRKILKERYILNQMLTDLNNSSSVAVDPIYNKELRIKNRNYESNAIFKTYRKPKGLLTAKP